MARINILGLILRHHKFKVILSCITFVVLFNTLLYTHFFTVFEVIPSYDILSNLVSEQNPNHTSINCAIPTYHTYDLQYPDLHLPADLNTWVEKLNVTKGEWKPTHCNPQFFIAIIIPYRNREFHLKIFLYNMHPFLQKQNIHYKIYVVEQSDQHDFNRGKLFNIGFIEALNDHNFPCFILHDVDLLPQNLNNIYACTRFPRHMSSSIDKFRYQVPYDSNFGGVTAIQRQQFQLVNGFSNYFYGWGGEDDDFYNRVRLAGLRVCRFTQYISRYASLPHTPAPPNKQRMERLRRGLTTYSRDGLNTLNYRLKNKFYNSTHVHVFIST